MNEIKINNNTLISSYDVANSFEEIEAATSDKQLLVSSDLSQYWLDEIKAFYKSLGDYNEYTVTQENGLYFYDIFPNYLINRYTDDDSTLIPGFGYIYTTEGIAMSETTSSGTVQIWIPPNTFYSLADLYNLCRHNMTSRSYFYTTSATKTATVYIYRFVNGLSKLTTARRLTASFSPSTSYNTSLVLGTGVYGIAPLLVGYGYKNVKTTSYTSYNIEYAYSPYLVASGTNYICKKPCTMCVYTCATGCWGNKSSYYGYARILKNGSAIATIQTSSAGNKNASTTATVSMNVGDYLTFQAKGGSSSYSGFATWAVYLTSRGGTNSVTNISI